jgi:hypothetical protein
VKKKWEAFYEAVQKVMDGTPKDNTKVLVGNCIAKCTWVSANGVNNNMIDFLMVEQKWKSSVKGCRSFFSADIESEHQLVLCKFQMTHESRKRTRHEKQGMTQTRSLLYRNR